VPGSSGHEKMTKGEIVGSRVKHKKAVISVIEGFVVSIMTACGRFNVAESRIHWKHTTCKQCLKRKPKKRN